MSETGAGRSVQPSLWLGVLFMLGSTLCGAADTMIARIVAREIDPLEIAFFRNLFSLAFMLPWLLAAGRGALATRRMPMHVARALLKIASLALFYFAVARLPLAEVTTIAFSTPLFVAVGAVLLLGERMTPARALAVLIGFLGVLIVLRPTGAGIGPAAIAAIVSAVIGAAVALMVKSLSRTDPPHTIVMVNLIVSVPLALLLALPFWTWPSWPMLGLLLAQGVIGAVAQLCITKALRQADVSLLMPLDFIRLPLVALLAFLLYAELPGLWTWVGAAVILVATLQGVGREGRRSGIAGRGRHG